jgi:plastocyanin
MNKRIFFVLCAAVLVLAACGSDKKSTSASSASSGGSGSSSSSSSSSGGPTIQVDGTSDKLNFESIAYFPKAATVAAGTTLTFHSNFQGEPHTVTFGSSIDTALKAFNALPPDQQQQQGPPPPEIAALKIPFVIPDDANFNDPSTVKLNQSAAQPCVVAAGAFAPGAEPCPNQKPESYDGSQTFVNSGLLKADQDYELTLAPDLAPGTYSYVCLFHGPEMQGAITVVAKDATTAQSADAIKAAGQKEIDDAVTALTPEVDKATTGAQPGEVKAGVDAQHASAIQFTPKEISVPVGGSVTWNLGFHTVSFNAPEDARPDVIQDADGTWHFNAKSFTPVGYTPPAPPADSGPPASDASPPAPLNVDGGTFDGTSFYSSGAVNSNGEVLFKLTFSKAGTYKYTCLIHPDMEGTVKVG